MAFRKKESEKNQEHELQIAEIFSRCHLAVSNTKTATTCQKSN